jgi:LmbE family N-acetylglucosaminyl deacetylase
MKQTVGFIYAHPDDETFLSACLIRQLADQGYEPVVLLATKGDAGNKNGDFSHLNRAELADMREEEMRKAALIMGICSVEYLGYPDGKLNIVDTDEFTQKVISYINKYRLKIIFTFPEDGGNGHPDHITISQITTKAVLSGKCPSVQKLYYIASTAWLELGRVPAYSIDTEPQWEMKAEALRAHKSQIFAIERFFGKLEHFPENRRYESFVLAWERGNMWPDKQEKSIFDRIIPDYSS